MWAGTAAPNRLWRFTVHRAVCVAGEGRTAREPCTRLPLPHCTRPTLPVRSVMHVTELSMFRYKIRHSLQANPSQYHGPNLQHAVCRYLLTEKRLSNDRCLTHR
jgi:hypothetical protein